jgi:hypothetical protein
MIEMSTRTRMWWDYQWETDLHAIYHILEMSLPPVHDQQLSTKLDVDLHPFDRQDPYPLQLTDICETPPPASRTSTSRPFCHAGSRLTSATAS